MSKILNAFLKLKKIQSARPNIPHYTLLKSTLLVLILAIAFLIRVLPIRWGYYLNEFDPYQQYRQTKYILENETTQKGSGLLEFQGLMTRLSGI